MIKKKTSWSNKKIPAFLLDLIFPKLCIKCRQEGTYLCDKCRLKISSPRSVCPACSEVSPFGIVHNACQSRNIHLTGLLTAARYDDQEIRNLIWLLKYSSASDITEDLALLLCDHLAEQNLLEYFGNFHVTAVPLQTKRLKMRGFNQAELLAERLAEKLNYPFSQLLTKTKATRRQVDLERSERLLNVKNSFAILPESLMPEKILLIDDVATTGATLNECAKALKQAGAQDVWGLVIARNK